MDANTELFDAQVRHLIGLQRYGAGEIRQMLALLAKVEEDILAKLVKTEVQGLSRTRLEKLLDAIRELHADGYAVMTDKLREAMGELAEYEAAYQAQILESTIPIEFDVVRPTPAQVRAAAFSRPFQGRLLREWVKDFEASAFAKVRDAVRIGFVEGETTDVIIRRIRGTRAEGYKDGVMQINRRNAAALVRTAISHTANSARQDVFEANSDIIKGVRWTSTLDGSTSAGCRALDGKVFALDKGPRPPRHPSCRSTTVPVLKSWREMGIDADEAPASTRASMGGQVPATETYDSWLRKQPVEFQDEVLGPSKAKLFRAGVTMDRFVNKVGDELTLEQLKKQEGVETVRKSGLAA
jgi:SPP1 gp7 family putative phage head morphogenesis protein